MADSTLQPETPAKGLDFADKQNYHLYSHHHDILKYYIGIHLVATLRYNTCLCMILAFLQAGCSEPEDQLAKQSPFHQEPPPGEIQKEIIVVTCRFYPLEIQGHADLSEMPIWSIPSSDNPADTQLSAQDIKKWRDNGLLLATVPIDQWEQLATELEQRGAISLQKKEYRLHHWRDVAEFVTYYLEDAEPLFVKQENTPPRGYTIGPGNCLFQVSCSLSPENPATEPFYIKIVPACRLTQPRDRRGNTSFATPYKLISEPEILFENLQLNFNLSQKNFICIAPKPNKTNMNNLGKMFLSKNIGADNYQLMLLVVPELFTAKQIKDAWQKQHATKRSLP